MKQEKAKYIRIAIGVVLAAFLLLVVFNLVRGYSKADVDSDEINANLTAIEQLQTAEVAEIEKAVETLDRANQVDSSASKKIRYRRAFSKAIVLGDSLTEGLTVYDWLTHSQVSAKVGGSIVYADQQFQTAAKTFPEYAFFAFGMNDMGNYGGDEVAFVKKYKSLLKAFSETSTDTTICVCSISTPTAGAIKGNKSISHYIKFNKAIEKMCEDEGYIYVDIADILPKHPELYAGDGIHAAPSYYPLWMDRMIEVSGM
ncbi:MAG: GDSL-type esterase/lipase family protein [Firmicutes bacterium]|nr:GDSL-type esterase/lipase family protein [Bacillota bacterium]